MAEQITRLGGSGIFIWEKILQLLDDKLQYAFLEQTKAVREVHLSANILTLIISSEEAFTFFSNPSNQQRLLLLSRPVCICEGIKVVKV